jgi:hypothetical protein
MGDILSRYEMRIGVSLLFGLGATPASRAALLDLLQTLRSEYGQPSTISMNWAVQHPLCGMDGDANHRYLDWPVADPELVEPLSHFGEASTLYCLRHTSPPTLGEVAAIVSRVDAILDPGSISEPRKVADAHF